MYMYIFNIYILYIYIYITYYIHTHIYVYVILKKVMLYLQVIQSTQVNTYLNINNPRAGFTRSTRSNTDPGGLNHTVVFCIGSRPTAHGGAG